MRSRLRLSALGAATAATLALSACGTDVRSQTAEQVAGGDVVVTTRICQTRIPTGCRDAPSSVSQGKQLLVAFRVPAGVEAPETIKARVPIGYGGDSVRLRLDGAYSAWVQQQPSAIDAPSKSYGYVSDTLPMVATDDTVVTARFAARDVSRFEFQTITGYRTGDHLKGADRPVDCTGEQQAKDESEERFTDCASGGTSVGGAGALRLGK